MKYTFTEYVRNRLLEADCDRMEIEAKHLGERLSELLYESFVDGNEEVEMTDAERHSFETHLQNFVNEYYPESVEMANEINNETSEYLNDVTEDARGDY